MTETLVVRLDRKELADIDAAARKRSISRSAYVRALLRREIQAEPKKGVGWAEHFEWLRKHGRRVDAKIVDEVIAESRRR
jgi:hypothetical protein